MKIKNIPEELLKKREAIECNFIFSLFKEPDLFADYNHIENNEDIITEDGKFYYGLGCALIKAGFQTFDAMSIETFLADKKKAKEEYEKRGGYRSIQDIMSLISNWDILYLFLRIVRYLLINAYSRLVFLIFDLRIERILIILVEKCNILD